MKHSQTFIHCTNTIFLMTDSVAEDGSSREKTEIHTLSHIMAFRDFWYDEWIRLRKFDHVDAQTEQHNEKIQWAKVLSVSAVSAFIRHINQTDYIYYTSQDTNIENCFEPILADSIDLSSHIQTENVRPFHQIRRNQIQNSPLRQHFQKKSRMRSRWSLCPVLRLQ